MSEPINFQNVAWTIIVLGVIYVLFKRYVTKRRAQFRNFAIQHGLQYSSKTKSLKLFDGDLPIFWQLRDPTIWNLVEGLIEQRKTWLFDMSYSRIGAKHLTFEMVGSGGDGPNTRCFQTVIAFESNRLNLPYFYLYPENFLYKLAEKFGLQDINFSAFPEFSRNYILRGNNEEDIRRIFSDRVLSFFNEVRGVCVEGSGNMIVFYSNAYTVLPKDKLDPFFNDSLTVVNLFEGVYKS